MEKNKRKINIEELEKSVLETLYSRTLCKQIGIDYNNPKKEDWDKARQYLKYHYFIVEEK
jgi:hypothetical protein